MLSQGMTLDVDAGTGGADGATIPRLGLLPLTQLSFEADPGADSAGRGRDEGCVTPPSGFKVSGSNRCKPVACPFCNSAALAAAWVRFAGMTDARCCWIVSLFPTVELVVEWLVLEWLAVGDGAALPLAALNTFP